MLACSHFKKFGMTTYIGMGEHRWNAWVEVYDSHNKLYYNTFETGLRYDYLLHLLSSPSCREEVGVSENEVRALLEEVEKEWKEVTRDC